jgi:hypothetical protein
LTEGCHAYFLFGNRRYLLLLIGFVNYVCRKISQRTSRFHNFSLFTERMMSPLLQIVQGGDLPADFDEGAHLIPHPIERSLETVEHA